jgi:hypothetical protein
MAVALRGGELSGGDVAPPVADAYSVLRSAIADAVTRQFLPLRFA